MQAGGDDFDPIIVLDDLRGMGKRRWLAAEEDVPYEASTPATKVQKISTSASPRSPRSPPSRQGTTRGRITKANIEAVRDQLSNLTIKNQEIKSSMHEWRKTLVEELFSHMRVRNIAIAQLGRSDIDEEMRGLCTEALQNRKKLIVVREEELLSLERLLSGHAAVLEFADSAYSELVEKIKILETWASQGQDHGLSMLDFPHMSKLARLTGGETKDTPDPTVIELFDDPIPFSSFNKFNNLPAEIRVQIWRAALPGPRIITHSSTHNASITLLSTCCESRKVVLNDYTELLSPTASFPQAVTPILYVSPTHDTIVRDLTLSEPHISRLNELTTSIFQLAEPDFDQELFRFLSGLARIQHLALSFDLLHENGGVLFGSIQACCPALKTLTLFPSTQSHRRYSYSQSQNSKRSHFIPLDSNLVDYVYARHANLGSRKLKRKARRGLDALMTLANHKEQYMGVFPSYVRIFGRDWRPTIRVCLLAHWKESSQGFQTSGLDGDKYSKGFRGDDDRLHKGFIESLRLADTDGELFSRYDGISDLFAINGGKD